MTFIFKRKAESFTSFKYILFAGVFIGAINQLSTDAPVFNAVVTTLLLLSALGTNRITHKAIVDLQNKQIVEIEAMGSKKKTAYDEIDKIFINPVNTSQKVSSRISSTIARNRQYVAFIKLDGVRKIKLLESKDKNEILSKLHPIQEATGIEIMDRTV